MKEIVLLVQTQDGQEPFPVTAADTITVVEFIEIVHPGKGHEMYLVVGDEPEPRAPHHRLHEIGFRDRHPVHIHHRVIHYKVDGDEQESERHKLSAKEILAKAGFDPAKTYLIRLIGKCDEVRYKDDPDKVIHLHDGMRFVTADLGPATVS